jgi:hypothetical protein
MRRTLIITFATIVLVALASTLSLLALAAAAGSHPTCGRVHPAELRHPSDPAYGTQLTKLARCGD